MLGGLLVSAGIFAAGFVLPGINYPAQVREEVSILPGGRVLRPFGRQVLTGPAPFAISVSPSGKTIVTANLGLSTAIGLDRPSITVIVPGKKDAAWNLSDYHAEPRRSDSRAWQAVAAGLVVTSDGSAWVSEGDTGRVVEVSLSSGARKNSLSLNIDTYAGSFTHALAFDSARNLLFVLDQKNDRVALVDSKRAAVLSSVKTGSLPSALALSGDNKRLYVASAGGTLSFIDISDAAAPKKTAEIALSGPLAGVTVKGQELYVSLPQSDAVAVVNAAAAKLETEIPLRIPGLEAYRGITPLGIAVDAKSGLLLVAEAGINAIGVIDPAARKVTGHLPVGWFPTAIALHDGEVYAAGARGFGTGPISPAHRIRMMGGGNRGNSFNMELQPAASIRGSVSSFAVPAGDDLVAQTKVVMQANGFVGAPAQNDKKTPPVRNVVLIVKGNRSFDEVLGDLERAGDKTVLSEPTFARFGSDGYVSGGRKKFSLRVNVTPNHHQIVKQWTFDDNFYSDSDYARGGRRWLEGITPDLWNETALLYSVAGGRAPGAESKSKPLEDHLRKHEIEFREFEEDAAPSDQARATHFIDAMKHDYLDAGRPLPRLMMIHLPNDAPGPAKPEEGYEYSASYIADNDYALGRLLEFLSQSPWWKEMAVFVTESGAEGGADHIDSHRTFLLAAGPWFRSDYVSHANSSYPSLLSTIFNILGVPPLNLYDATAGDMLDLFGTVPDFAPFELQPEDARLFDPTKVK